MEKIDKSHHHFTNACVHECWQELSLIGKGRLLVRGAIMFATVRVPRMINDLFWFSNTKLIGDLNKVNDNIYTLEYTTAMSTSVCVIVIGKWPYYPSKLLLFVQMYCMYQHFNVDESMVNFNEMVKIFE